MEKGARPRPRIDDVARKAGVSKTAVSFAFNRPDRLNSDTANRILSVAKALGYRPNPVARMLTQRRTMSIGLVTPQALSAAFANPFFGSLAEGIALVAEQAGYALHFISPDRGSLGRALDRATVDGLVVIGLPAQHPEVDRLREAGLPMVLVDSVALPDIPSISVDDEGGAYQAARHVLELGHRDVLTIAIAPHALYPPGESHGVGPDRLRGYDRAFRDLGIPFRESWLVSEKATIEGGAAGLADAWAQGLRPTAVIAMSDAIAIGVLAASRSIGLRVPDDLSVVGFDDIDIAAHTNPPLTTVHQPILGKGEAATRLLLAMLDGGDIGAEETRLLETSLVVRASTGRAPVPSQRP
ncbi:MAG: LacI family DNA-binding transcriptional regulator [Chloroflexota bacterium]